MPIYLVRWPNLSAALVRARDDDDLVTRLDELDDPSFCTWQLYTGPLWVEFNMSAQLEVRYSEGRPLGRADLVLSNIEQVLDDHLTDEVLHASIADAETGTEMRRELLERCFPAASAVLQRIRDEEEDGQLRPDDPPRTPEADAASDAAELEALREALLDDLAPLVKGDWRARAERKRLDPT